MKKIALIGANGQLGSDIVSVFSSDSYFRIFPLTQNEFNIKDIEKTEQVLENINPQLVVNTAAYHRVDEIEDNPEKAFLVNVIAEKNLGEICEKNGWSLAFFSTDYVFGLDKNRKIPYVETDAPGPVNTYGVSKLAGEFVTRFSTTDHYVIRLCGLFGVSGAVSKGGNFVETMIKLGKEKGKVQVVNDQILTPTYTKNVAENLLELLKTENYGVYHMTAEGACSWWEFAREIFRLLKMNVKCIPVTSGQFKTQAKRPTYSVLENQNLKKSGLNRMVDWRKGLQLYLKEKGYL